MTSEDRKALRDGRYVLLAPLGQGAQGTTWDAVDKREGRPVAIKAFDVRGARAWKDVELAEREARVLSELSHPALPRYFEHFEEDGTLYLVMEKVHGTPLSVVQKKEPRMSEKDLLRFLHDADSALTYLHGRSPPVIHRDLKPSNVIRRTDGSYGFVDFGAVRDRLRPEGGSTVVGTFGYMAPEQFQGRAGPASDVYSVGATAIALLTGTEPEKLPHRGLSLDVDAALAATGRVSPWVAEVLKKMLEPNPDERATRIGPLLDGVGRVSERGKRARARADSYDGARESVASAFRGLEDRVRDSVRHAEREARSAAKRARKEARRSRRARGRRHQRIPLPLRVFFGLGLSIAQVAVAMTLGVVVPLVLTLLSVVFGEALRRAAQSVREAGHDANEAMRHALDEQDEGRGGFLEDLGAIHDAHVGARVAPRPEAAETAEPAQREPEERVRVAIPATRVPRASWEEEETLAEAALEEEEKKKRARR